MSKKGRLRVVDNYVASTSWTRRRRLRTVLLKEANIASMLLPVQELLLKQGPMGAPLNLAVQSSYPK